MKVKLLLVLLVVMTGCVYAQTWTRHLAWEDLVPAWEDHPDAEAYNVIPAIGGGYLMHGVLTLHDYEEIYVNVFWKVTPGGEVVWRNDQLTYDLTPMTCLVSNGSDKYYGLSPDYHQNILYTYDSQLNPIHSIMIDTLLTNGEYIGLSTMIAVDDGLVLVGRNRSYPFIMKLDNNLEHVWSHTFNGLDSSAFWDIKQTLDGGFVCSGHDELLRLNSQGDSLWVYSITPPVTGISLIVQLSDGSFILPCSLEPYQQGITHIDPNGNYLNSHPYVLPGISGGIGWSFIATNDEQLMILRLRYDSTPEWVDYGMLHKMSQVGESIWHNVFHNYIYDLDVGRGRHPIFIDDAGFYVFCATPMSIIKADENGNAVSNNDQANDATAITSVHAYPNPAVDKINFVLSNIPKTDDLSLAVYNLRGQILHKIDIDENAKLQAWDLPPELGTGVYLYRLIDGKRVIKSGKFTIL